MEEQSEAIIQVVEASVCPRFEDLVPLTEEEADALTDLQAGERMQAIGIHCKMLVEKARTVVLRFLPEITSMRKRYSQPGRRNPIPGLPTWKKVNSTYFPFSDSHMRRLLAEPKPEDPQEHARPEETGTSEEPEAGTTAASTAVEEEAPKASGAQPQPEGEPAAPEWDVRVERTCRMHEVCWTVVRVHAPTARAARAEVRRQLDDDSYCTDWEIIEERTAYDSTRYAIAAPVPVAKPATPPAAATQKDDPATGRAAVRAIILEMLASSSRPLEVGDFMRDPRLSALPDSKIRQMLKSGAKRGLWECSPETGPYGRSLWLAKGVTAEPAPEDDDGISPESLAAFRKKYAEKAAAGEAAKQKALADLDAAHGERRKCADELMRWLASDMVHAWGLGNFRDHSEYLRGLTDNFLRDTLNLLVRAGKARRERLRGDTSYIHADGKLGGNW